MIDRPILFVGPTRSGKSMLGNIVGQLPEFHLAFEPQGRWNYRFSNKLSDVRTQEEASEEVCRSIRAQIERSIDSTDATRYIDDLPHHALRIGFCHAVLPEARFVMVSRDGRSAIRDMKWGWEYKDTLGKVMSRRFGQGNYRSINFKKLPMQGARWLNNAVRRLIGRRRSTWGPTVPGQFAFARTHSLIETIAFQWASYAEHALDGLQEIPSEQVLYVRYESVLKCPKREAERLAEFCEIENAQNLIDLAQQAIESGREPYSKPLSQAELERIEPIISPIQRRLGYND